MINEYTYNEDVWYISKDEPYTNGFLESGLHLTSKREFFIFTNENDYIQKCNELGINLE